jgi:hypothetical protein
MSTPRASWTRVCLDVNPDSFIKIAGNMSNHLIDLCCGVFSSTGEHVGIRFEACGLYVGETLNGMSIDSAERAISSGNNKGDVAVLHAGEVFN